LHIILAAAIEMKGAWICLWYMPLLNIALPFYFKAIDRAFEKLGI